MLPEEVKYPHSRFPLTKYRVTLHWAHFGNPCRMSSQWSEFRAVNTDWT